MNLLSLLHETAATLQMEKASLCLAKQKEEEQVTRLVSQ